MNTADFVHHSLSEYMSMYRFIRLLSADLVALLGKVQPERRVEIRSLQDSGHSDDMRLTSASIVSGKTMTLKVGTRTKRGRTGAQQCGFVRMLITD